MCESKGESVVWALGFGLEAGEAELAALSALLAPEEKARAERFYFPRHRRQFIVARGRLRRTLGEQLAVAPERLVFAYGPHGKPELAWPARTGLDFNLSHAGERALLAWTGAGAIGVDIERLRPVTPGLAQRFFAAEEAEALAALPVAEQEAAFFRCWTRKEAYLKALGSGLARPLEGFVVSLAPGQPARLLAVRGDPEEARHWRLEHLDPAPGYCAAIALRRAAWQLQWRDEG